MDSFNPPNINSMNANIIKNIEENAEEEEMDFDDGTFDEAEIFPFNRATFVATFRHQIFSFPDTIIHYISKNPTSSKFYQKLIQICKYFFIKNPIIVVPNLTFRAKFNEDGWWTIFDGIDVEIQQILGKLWVTDELEIINCHNEKLAPLTFPFMSKIYQCDAKKCTLEYIDFSLKDLIFLVSKAEILIMYSGITVFNEDGTVVTLDKIIAEFPNLKYFYYYLKKATATKIITSKTVEKLIQIPHFSNFCSFKLAEIPETFDIETFYAYLKGNKKTKFHICFEREISEVYETRLHDILIEIVETKTHDYEIPFIDCYGLDEFWVDKMMAIYDFCTVLPAYNFAP